MEVEVVESVEDIVRLVNALEANEWPFLSNNRKFPWQYVAVLTLQIAPGVGSGSAASEDVVEELLEELLEEDELKDCISISTQVAEIVEAVPNILKPLSIPVTKP